MRISAFLFVLIKVYAEVEDLAVAGRGIDYSLQAAIAVDFSIAVEAFRPLAALERAAAR